MKKHLAALLCFAFLIGCSSDELPPAKFVDTPSNKILLNVATIDIVDHSQYQPSNSPYHTFNLQPTIAETVRHWVKDNVQAGGNSGQAIVIIQDASLSAQALATSDATMDRWFKRQQASQYKGHISVQMEIHSGKSDGMTDAEATHSITLPETPTDTERQNAYVALLTDLNKDFRENFDKSLREHTPWALLSGQ